MVLIAPTSRRSAPVTFRPELHIAGDVTSVLVEQIRAIDLHRFGEQMGRLASQEQRAVDEALELTFGL